MKDSDTYNLKKKSETNIYEKSFCEIQTSEQCSIEFNQRFAQLINFDCK
jgi:hypothetical protein